MHDGVLVLSLTTRVLVLARVLVLDWPGVLVLSLGARVLVLYWYQAGVLVLQWVIMLGWRQQDR